MKNVIANNRAEGHIDTGVKIIIAVVIGALILGGLYLLFAGEGGIINRYAEADGTLYVEPVANEGYVFDGYYVDGAKIDGAKIDGARFDFNVTTTVEVRFVAAK